MIILKLIGFISAWGILYLNLKSMQSLVKLADWTPIGWMMFTRDLFLAILLTLYLFNYLP